MLKIRLLIIFILPSFLWAQGIKKINTYEENNLWGLTDNKPITPAIYDTLIALTSSSNYISQKHNPIYTPNNKGIISDKGKVIVPHEYVSITPYETAIVVSKWQNDENLFGLISHENKVILNVRFKSIRPFESHWLATSQGNGLSLYNAKGKIIKTIEADRISDRKIHGSYRTFKGGKIGIISANGDKLFSPSFKSINYNNGKWNSTYFANWHVITSNDTISYTCDTVLLWTKETVILGFNGQYQIETNKVQEGKSYAAIDVMTSTLAICKNKNLYGAITIDGLEILPIKFDKVYYQKGYFYAHKNNVWNLFDSLGVIKSVFDYDSIGAESDGLFPIKRKGKWGFMDRSGKEIIHCIYDTLANFKNGKVIITYFGKKGIVSQDGTWVVKPIYDDITGFDFGYYTSLSDNQYFLKSYGGELIYFSVNLLNIIEGIIYETLPNGKQVEISRLGTKIMEATANNGDYYDSWHVIAIDNKYGFVDSNGQLTITYRYDSLLAFSEERAAFKLRGKWGFIDLNERIIVQPVFSSVTSFNNGKAIVEQKNQFGLINNTGNFIVKPAYDTLVAINDSIWLTTSNQLKGLVSSRGKLILHPIFNEVDYIDDSLIIVRKKDKYGAVNTKGVSVIPRLYEYIGFHYELDALVLKKNL